MPNIRIDLDYAIEDGAKIMFRSPCDCTEITGLIVYYVKDGEQKSKEFTLADAHGENVGYVPNLFASDVVVKVILDVSSGMAYVQNADTNTYIENTFVKTVNGVTPDKNGNVNVAGGGASSWNDLTGKPFYEESSTETLLVETDYPFQLNSALGCYASTITTMPFTFVDGKAYRIHWDNDEYVRTAFSFTSADGSACVAVGNPVASGGVSNNDSFAIIVDTTHKYVHFCSLETLDSHKVAIYQDTTVVKTLDAKFLPMDAIDGRIEQYINEALEGEY